MYGVPSPPEFTAVFYFKGFLCHSGTSSPSDALYGLRNAVPKFQYECYELATRDSLSLLLFHLTAHKFDELPFRIFTLHLLFCWKVPGSK